MEIRGKKVEFDFEELFSVMAEYKQEILENF